MTLTSLDITFIIIYFAVLFIIGYVSSRRQKKEGYLIADRSLGSFSTFATINASKTGSILMIFVALVYLWGIAALWYFIGMMFGMLIFIPFAMKLKDNSQKRFYTLADYFKHNYGRGAAIAASAITIFLMFGFMVTNLIAGAKIFVFFTSWPFWLAAVIMVTIVLAYLLLGGFSAVVKTDVVQYVAIVFLMILLAVTLFKGSLIPASEWNFFKVDALLIVGFFLVGMMFPFAMPDMWQRVYASKNKSTLKKGILISIVVYGVVAFLLGLVALVVKNKFPEVDPDLALIHGFAYLLSPGILGLAVVMLFSAIMSSIDTYFFTGASAIVQDHLKLDKAGTVKAIRLMIIILAVLGTIVSIALQSLIISSYIFVSFILVLATIVLATWIRPKIRSASLIVGFIIGSISLIALLAYYFIFKNGDIAPILVGIAIVMTVVGLVMGGALVRKRRV